MAASNIPTNAPPERRPRRPRFVSQRSCNVIRIDIANQQRLLKLDRRQLRAAVRRVLAAHDYASAEISLAIVDDATIHELNRQWLNHDYPTDVISFVLDERPGHVEGEIVASAETAARIARDLETATHEELLLYIVHGMLHLVGFDDQTPSAASEMRAQERSILADLGITAVDRESLPSAPAPQAPRAPR